MRVLVLIMLAAAVAFSAEAQTKATSPEQYRIVAGDKIGISVFGQPDLSSEATVDSNGTLRLPMIGDVPAANLTLSELEAGIARALEQGYVKRPMVNAKVAEFRPIYVIGMVRTPGHYPYREGESVLAAIARAGGIGTPAQAGVGADLFLTNERVSLLEMNRASLLAKRARLFAQQNGDERVDFRDMSGLPIDPVRLDQIREGEQRAFVAERQAEQQESDALQQQLPRLEAEIAALKQQEGLEARQRELNQQLITDYEQLAKSGLARKVNYIEIKREEARIEGNMARLRSEALKAELSIGELRFKMAELHNNYRRRVMTELRETERLLLELTVTLPSAQRARAARADQLLVADQGQQPPFAVIRGKGPATTKYDATADFVLQPGDIVQVGSLVPSRLESSPNAADRAEQVKAGSRTSVQMGAWMDPKPAEPEPR